MSDRLYQEAFLLNVCKLINYIFDNGYTCTGGELYRTPEQAEIYARQNKGITNSLHCRRLAIDLNLFHLGKYLDKSEDHSLFGEYWKSLHPMNRWGGDFSGKRKDGNHYEMNVDQEVFMK